MSRPPVDARKQSSMPSKNKPSTAKNMPSELERKNRTSHAISRRRILKSGVVSLALPALPSLAPRSAWSDTPDVPRRIVYWWFPDGTIQEEPDSSAQGGEDFSSTGGKNWFPKGGETDFTLSDSPLSAPLESIKNELIFTRGIDLGFERSEGCPHSVGPRFSMGALSPDSIDQVIGEEMKTRFKTLEFGVGTWKITRGDSRISYKGDQPIEPIADPNQIFQKIFGDPSQIETPQAQQAFKRLQLRKQSVLDSVLAEINTIKNNAGREDKDKLDAYYTSVFDTERALGDLSSDMASEDACSTPNEIVELVSDVDVWHGEKGGAIHQNFERIAQVQMDLLVLALRCNQTQVASIMFEKGRSTQRYRFLDLPVDDENHGLAHKFYRSQGQTESWFAVHKWRAELFGKLVDKLAKTDDIDGSRLLDNMLVIKTSELTTGGHGYKDMPFVLAGGFGGKLKTGRYLDFRSNRKNQMQLHLEIARQMGVGLERYPLEPGRYSETGRYLRYFHVRIQLHPLRMLKSHGNPGNNTGSFTRGTFNNEGAPDVFEAFSHATEPEVTRGPFPVCDVKANAVVSDNHGQNRRGFADQPG